MQVEAAAALAPVLARFAIVVDGPLEAEVVTRLVSGGETRTTLADLARPFPGRPELSRPDAVAVARAVVTRLMASGAVEAIGGGYRIADPALAATLQRVVDAVVAAGRPLTSPVPAPAGQVPATVPVTVEDASRVLQQTLAARSLAPSLPAAVPIAVSGPVIPPGVWAELVAAGWTLGTGAGGGGGAGGGVVAAGITLQPPANTGTGPAVRLVVADADAPVALVAPRLAEARPVILSHLPAPPVTWGQGDPELARTVAAGLRSLAAAPAGNSTAPAPAHAPLSAPLVVDRGMVPALTVLAREDALPPVVVVDLRSAPTTAPPRVGPGLAPAPAGPDAMAAAMAGAVGAAAQRRRVRAAGRRGPVDAAAIMEVLFGPRFAAAIDGADEDGDVVDGDGEGAGEQRRSGNPDAQDGPPTPADGAVPPARAGAVVTSRTKDRQAAALAELLGVEVQVMAAGDDLGPEVLAWLDDESGSTLLAPRA